MDSREEEEKGRGCRVLRMVLPWASWQPSDRGHVPGACLRLHLCLGEVELFQELILTVAGVWLLWFLPAGARRDTEVLWMGGGAVPGGAGGGALELTAGPTPILPAGPSGAVPSLVPLRPAHEALPALQTGHHPREPGRQVPAAARGQGGGCPRPVSTPPGRGQGTRPRAV